MVFIVLFVKVKIFACSFYHNIPPPLKLNVSACTKSLDISASCSHNTRVLTPLSNTERWLSWSKALDSKSNVAEMSPRVRIPLSPRYEKPRTCGAFLSCAAIMYNYHVPLSCERSELSCKQRSCAQFVLLFQADTPDKNAMPYGRNCINVFCIPNIN